MFGFAFSKRADSQAELIIDVGSKSVGGGIFEKIPNGGAKLLYTAREPIAFQTELTGDNLFASMTRSLNNLLLHLQKYGVSHLRTPSGQKYRIHSANVIISSPWHASETKTLRLNFDKPIPITKSVIGEILEKEEKSFESQLAGNAKIQRDFCVLERKIIEMRLNGYSTETPYGKEADNLEILMFNSIISSKILEKIESLINRYFHIENFIFHSFSVASFVSIRDLFPGTQDFSIVQIGGEITDIIIVKKGSIAETISFPVGHNGLIRVLEKICANHPHCSLETMVKLHRETGVTAADMQKVERAVNDTRSLWLEHFNNTVANSSGEAFLPNTVFLFEESSFSPLFEKTLREAVPGKLTVTAGPFLVKSVEREMSEKLEAVAGNLLADPILSMETAFSASLSAQNFIGRENAGYIS
jgi:hypothetical protein